MNLSKREKLLLKVEIFLMIILQVDGDVRTSIMLACIQKNAFRKVVNCVTEEEEFFHPVTGSFKRYIDKCMKMEEFHGAMESIRRFILISGQCNPGRISVVLIFVKLLMKKKELHKEMAPILFRLLTSLTSSSIEDISHLEWKELPLTLKASEISSEDLINAINLRPVKICLLYTSPSPRDS